MSACNSSGSYKFLMFVNALPILSITLISPRFIYWNILTVSPNILAFIRAPQINKIKSKINRGVVLGIKSSPVRISIELYTANKYFIFQS